MPGNTPIIQYENPVIVNNEVTLPATLTTSETQLFLTTSQQFLHKSQLTVMMSVVSAGLSSATFNYYMGVNTASTGTPTWAWYPICLYNTSTGVLTQRAVVLNSTSYSASSSWWGGDDVPLGAMMAFRVTGYCNTGTPAYTLNVYSRDN